MSGSTSDDRRWRQGRPNCTFDNSRELHRNDSRNVGESVRMRHGLPFVPAWLTFLSFIVLAALFTILLYSWHDQSKKSSWQWLRVLSREKRLAACVSSTRFSQLQYSTRSYAVLFSPHRSTGAANPQRPSELNSVHSYFAFYDFMHGRTSRLVGSIPCDIIVTCQI